MGEAAVHLGGQCCNTVLGVIQRVDFFILCDNLSIFLNPSMLKLAGENFFVCNHKPCLRVAYYFILTIGSILKTNRFSFQLIGIKDSCLLKTFVSQGTGE